MVPGMSEEMPSEIPEEPEAPDIVKVGRWLKHHFQNEGRVIWRAPFTAAVLLGVGFGASSYLGHQREENAASTIQNQQTEIALLEAQNRGSASGSIDINRAKKLAKLQEFYSTGTDLFNIFWKDELKDDAEKQEWNKKVIVWCHGTDDWIKANMGVAAQRRFENVMSFSGDRDTNIDRDGVGAGYMMAYLTNLSALIENPSWDRVSAP